MKEICEKTSCTGCTACAAVCPQDCISMQSDEQGFLRPVIRQADCVDCGLCRRSCPVSCRPSQRSEETAAYAAINPQPQRARSASGGIFPLLAHCILKQGGTVYGAAYDADGQVRHISITQETELPLLQGAKYVQSDLGNTFRRMQAQLEAGTPVLFSGTPCQVSGLYAFLGRSYDTLFVIDLICHGVPSPKAWRSYLAWRMREDGQSALPVSVNQRSKCSGWSRYRYSVELCYADGTQYVRPNAEDAYMEAFISNLSLRPSCSVCVSKGLARPSDITLGDYWGIWEQMPDMDDDGGTSVVLVHSAKGRQLLKQVRESLRLQKVDTLQAVQENSSAIASAPAHARRDEFLALLDTCDFGEACCRTMPVQPSAPPTWRQRIKRRLKRWERK